MYYVDQTASPTGVVTVDEVKTHLRISGTSEDTYLGTLISAAVLAAENFMNRPILDRDVTDYHRCFKRKMYFLRGGARAIDSIEYDDSNGSPEDLNLLDLNFAYPSFGAFFEFKPDKDIPATNSTNDAVRVTYNAGWETAADVPQNIKHAILLMIGDMYCVREDSVRNLPSASEMLLKPYVIWQHLPSDDAV